MTFLLALLLALLGVPAPATAPGPLHVAVHAPAVAGAMRWTPGQPKTFRPVIHPYHRTPGWHWLP